MSKENIKLLIKNEYENGTSMSVLSKKYSVKVNTIKTWSAKEKWIKKKQNSTTKRSTTTTKKNNRKKLIVNDRDVQIKKDIMNNVSKEEVLRKYDISSATYYRKAKSIRQARLEKTEHYLDMIAESIYPDLEVVLGNAERAKKYLIMKSIKQVGTQETDIKKIQSYSKAYDAIKKMANDVMRTNKILTSYELLEVEKQLSEEILAEEKLEIEKSKIKKDDDKDSEKEKEVIQLLRNITKKVEDNE
nr:MAG TPA: hypothetical protein [Caudoviricetes sp.]